MPLGRPSRSFQRNLWFMLIGAIFLTADLPCARGQPPAATPQALQADTSQNTPKPETRTPGDEIVSSDAPTTFKLRVNLVLVRVVVRDADGNVIANLKKEDFQLTDNHKPQIISSFSVETPASHVSAVKMETSGATSDATSGGTAVKAPKLPQGFVALFFDDLQLSVADAMYSRQAASKVLASLREGDRFALFTTSGQVEQDFTADRTKLDQAIQRIMPNLQGSVEDCMPPSVYLANQIIEVNDPTALAAAMKACGPEITTRAAAQGILSFGEYKVRREFTSLGAVIRRMSELPGQRTIVMVSPGFFVPSSIHESGDIIDRATKANIVISAIDARGLYTPSYADASTPPEYAKLAVSAPDLMQYLRTGERAQDDVLGELTDGTGGLFFHDRNDIEQRLLQAVTEPEVSYVLGFTPQNLKLDGRYHQLKVTLVSKQKWALQARHGYFAPHGESDAAAVAKEEIEQAVFSQAEMQDFPMQCQTQFFSGADGVHLTVQARIETNTLKFRKDQNLNDDNLTVVTAVFDENGNLLDGQQRVIEMKLKDATRERLNKEGLKVKSSFNLQPGSYLVRIVVRDSEGAQMAALNRGVVLP